MWDRIIKSLNKLEPKKRFYRVYTIIGLLTPFLVTFPIAFQLRFLGKWNPLWFVLDDSRKNPDGSLAEDYRIYLRKYKIRALGVLMWHMWRNKVWNLVDSFKVDNGEPTVGNQNIAIIRVIADSLRDFNDRKIPSDGPWVAGAGLKYVGEPGDDPWQVNSGDEISKTHSIIGEAEFYYITPSGWKGWRKTSCKLKRVWWMLGAKRWVTVYRGSGASRYSFKQKYQKDKLKVEWQP